MKLLSKQLILPVLETAEAPVAVLVCHGREQQVRFETISSVAEAIRTEALRPFFERGIPERSIMHQRSADDTRARFLFHAGISFLLA